MLVGDAAPADGVVRLRVTAPSRPGTAYVRARLDGATQTVLRVRVTERSR
jgi:hypothetical protein